MKPTQATIKVWDPIVRIGHWTLVLAFFIAYFTEDDLMTQHVWAGYVAGAVVCFRLLWGFVGTEHARFKDFVVSPAAVLQHVRDLRNKSGKRYIGHNPIGGAMIIALLISVAVTVYTGVALYAIEDHAGPLAAWFATESAASEPAGQSESSDAAEERERQTNGVAQAEDQMKPKIPVRNSGKICTTFSPTSPCFWLFCTSPAGFSPATFTRRTLFAPCLPGANGYNPRSTPATFFPTPLRLTCAIASATIVSLYAYRTRYNTEAASYRNPG